MCEMWACVSRYPKGVSGKQISKRVNGIAVMLYLLGLSYGAVEIVLNSLGMGIGKTACISSRAGCRQASAWNEERQAVERIQDKSGWCGCDQCTL